MSFRKKKKFVVWCVLRRAQAEEEASVSSASVSQYLLCTMTAEEAAWVRRVH